MAGRSIKSGGGTDIRLKRTIIFILVCILPLVTLIIIAFGINTEYSTPLHLQ